MAGSRALIFNLETLLPGCEALYRGFPVDDNASRERFVAEAAKVLRPVAGATEFLESCRGKAVGVVTTLPLKAAGELIKQAGWRGIFNVFVAAEHLTRPWPEPEIYELAIKRLKAQSAPVVFERSVEGIKAARRAGANVCAIGSGFQAWRLKKAGAELVVSDLTNIKKLEAILV